MVAAFGTLTQAEKHCCDHRGQTFFDLCLRGRTSNYARTTAVALSNSSDIPSILSLERLGRDGIKDVIESAAAESTEYKDAMITLKVRVLDDMQRHVRQHQRTRHQQAYKKYVLTGSI